MPRASRRSTSATRRTPAGRRARAALVVTRFLMPSERDAVAPAVARVLNGAKGAGLDSDQRADLAVAVSEALSNAAIHGNHLAPGSHVRVTIKVTPGTRAVVEVEDAGPGFDVGGVDDPTHPAHLLDTRGRGLFLMRRLVTRIEHNAAGNRVRLILERRARRRTD